MEKSPCVRICTLDNNSVCIGCGRNAYEIKNWSSFSDDIKRAVKQKLSGRLEGMQKEVRINKNTQ